MLYRYEYPGSLSVKVNVVGFVAIAETIGIPSFMSGLSFKRLKV